MDYSQTALNLIINKSDCSTLKDVFEDIVEIASKDSVDRNEYLKKRIIYANKYVQEIKTINERDALMTMTGNINRNPISYKNLLINLLSTIGAIKLLNKNKVRYSLSQINDYNFVISILENYN